MYTPHMRIKILSCLSFIALFNLVNHLMIESEHTNQTQHK